MKTTIKVTKVIESEDEAVQCDRCGAVAAAVYFDQRPDGWVVMKGPDHSSVAVDDYCSEECAAQTLAARVGKVLA